MWAQLADLFLLGISDWDSELEAALFDLYNEFRNRSSNEGRSASVGSVYEPSHSVALTLAIHGFQGHTVTVENFVCDGNRFSGTIKFHFYDHFGLDNDDYQFAPGFCDWYILQHYDRYDGKYCPFITIIDMSCDFSGTFS